MVKKRWSPSLQDQIVHGGRSPVAVDNPPGKEDRFEQWIAGSGAAARENHKHGRGNPYRRTLRARTQTWSETWDYSHHLDEIPAYDPLADPHCTMPTFAWTGEHAALRRKKRPRRQPLDADFGVWQRLLRPGWSHHRQRIQSESEKRPWPECEPDSSTLGGRGWRSYTADVLTIDRRQRHFADGYAGTSTQGNSDNYGICEASGKKELLMQTTVPPPWDHGLFQESWIKRAQAPHKSGGAVRAQSSLLNETGRSVLRLRNLPKTKSPRTELDGHDRQTYAMSTRSRSSMELR